MKKTNLFKIAGVAAGVALPAAMVFAQPLVTTPPFNGNQTLGAGGQVQYAGSFVDNILNFIRNLLFRLPPILVALAGVVFMFEVIRFIFAGMNGKAEEKDKIRTHMIMSLVALVVLLGFWGIVGIISNMLGIRPGASVTTSGIPGVQL